MCSSKHTFFYGKKTIEENLISRRVESIIRYSYLHISCSIQTMVLSGSGPGQSFIINLKVWSLLLNPCNWRLVCSTLFVSVSLSVTQSVSLSVSLLLSVSLCFLCLSPSLSISSTRQSHSFTKRKKNSSDRTQVIIFLRLPFRNIILPTR